MNGCPTCGRGGSWFPGDHASWCEGIRREHHDADVRAGTFLPTRIRDFDRWGWTLASGPYHVPSSTERDRRGAMERYEALR